MPDPPPPFAALPLDEQLAQLQDALHRREDPRSLLATCAAVRDHAPLAWLARRLLEQGWLFDAAQQAWMAEFLLQQPETAIDRGLKAMVGDGTMDARLGPSLRDTLLAMLERVTVDRVSVMCLVDRALKHNFAEARDEHVRRLTERCASALAEGRTDEVTVDHLAQVSSPGIATLREHAAAHGEATAHYLESTLARLAARTLEVLGHAPKAVSQANAEELLSKRVYTDPGHFLVELLQNAEDAGAVRFRLVFEPRRIVLWHDGKPFDTKDVVGVTSIGQTTKRKQQIGFFGVGFKSVYEVTDRPRIYSDVYRFEIADVSIPKALSSRPADLPADGTVLVLPLRNPADPERSPAALFRKARELDAIVLFTLRRIDVIELELHDEGGGLTRHAVHELPPDARGISRIRQEPEGWVRGYAVHDVEHVYHGGGRAPGRADRTRVMVGLRIDDDGVPRPLEPDTPTIYSYLPTEEHSGLRLFVQGHFDVPVDRERITQDSRWNEWILSKVPAGLASLAEALTRPQPDRDPQADAAQRLRVAEGLLCVLPLLRELGSPIFRRIVQGLRSAFASLAIVPCDDGALHPPGSTLVAEEGLAALFEGEPVRTEAGTRHLALRQLDARALEVARALGAASFDGGDLLGVLARETEGLPEGGRSHDAQAPIFLREPTAARLAACYEVLDEASHRRAGAGQRRLADIEALRRLRALPLVLSETDGLHRVGPSIVRGDPAVRAVYAGLRAFVHPGLDEAMDPEDPVRGAATRFLERLGVRDLGVRDLVADLEAQLGPLGSPVPDLGVTRFPGTPARLQAAIALLADAPPPVQRRAARLAIFRAQDGRYHRAASGPSDRGGVLLFEPGRLGDHLLAFYGDSRPIAAPAEDDPALALLRSARTPTLSLATLVADLQQRAGSLSEEDLDRLHALLEAVRDELPERTRRALAELPIWPDTQGRRRPLRGEGAVRIPGSPAIAALLPAMPFLHPTVLARRHATEMGGEAIGLDAMLDALDPEATPPLRIEPSPASITAVLEILRAERDAIHPRLRLRLAEVPAFLDDAGRPGRLDALSLAEDPALRAVYADWPARRFVDPDSLSRVVIAELELDARLTRTDTRTLAADLSSISDALDGRALDREPLPLVGGAEHLATLLRYCAEQASALPRSVVRTLVRTAIFPDQHHRLGALADAHATRLDENTAQGQAPGVHACEPSLREIFTAARARVVVPWAQEIASPLIEAAGRSPLDIVALVERLADLPPRVPGQPPAPVQSPTSLAAIHAALVEHASVLAHRFPPRPRDDGAPSSHELGTLAIWPTVAGGIAPAHALVDSPALAQMLPPRSPGRDRLEAVTPTELAAVSLRTLAPLVLPASAPRFAAQLVRDLAQPDRPLSEQTAPLDTTAGVAHLAAFIETVTDGPDLPRPRVDATGCLRLSPLRRADADTIALVAALPIATRLLHPEVAAALPPTPGEPSIEPSEIVLALVAGVEEPGPMTQHPALRDAERRARFYAWLSSHESAVFTDADARARLRSMPLFPTDRGTIRPADQLVVDPDLPALDVDWTPHPELPAATLALLVRHLGVGRPPVEDLVVDHLAPAYHRAAAAGDGPGAARLLEYLARALAATPPEEVHRLLARDGEILVEGSHARFVPASTLLLPSPERAAAVQAVFGTTHPPPHPRLPDTTHALLRSLGVARHPSRRWVADAMRHGIGSAVAATGLAMLVADLHRDDPEATLAELPLREVAWVLDGRDVPRKPTALFTWTTDVQALVGDAPELYPAPEIARTLGDALLDAIGLRTIRDVQLPEVVAHIDASRNAQIPVPFRVYQWLERGLSEGWLDGSALRQQLQGRAWICSDDGEYHPHERVLGVRALEHFGQRRGYWERGAQRCPNLCRLFGIAVRLSPAVLLAFLEEITAEAEARGDQALLQSEPALARMLLRAYASLGASPGAQPARCLLGRQCGGDDPGALRLRPVDDPLLLRSDAPALEEMFASAGRFFVTAPGSVDDRAEIDAYYERCGVRRLRQAYRVQVVDTGEDQTPHFAEAVAGLRVTLRGLLAVLPRVRLQRTHLDADAWVYETRLATLARTGPIHARADLQVDYLLEGVGRARTRALAVYDPRSDALLVDVTVLADPIAAVTGLAQGLMVCIYDGPGEEQLVDIVEILLRLTTHARMEAYLDQRFFPTAADAGIDPGGRLAARVGELFDYGLDRRLVARFESLRDRPLERWREPSLFAALPEDEEQAVRSVVARMLAAIELQDADQALVEALALLLSAASLSDVPAGLLGPRMQAEPPLPDALAPTSGGGGDATGERDRDDTGWAEDLPSLSELEARLSELTARADAKADADGSSPHRFVIPEGLDTPAWARARDGGEPGADGSGAWLDEHDLEGDASSATAGLGPGGDHEPEPEGSGFWRRLARRLGLADEQPRAEPTPAWAEPGANVLSPSRVIGPQLWVRGRTLRQMATHRVPMGLLHQPPVLPSPHRYVVHVMGSVFEPATQSWLPGPVPALPALFRGEATGHSVAFAGSLSPGRSVVPIPLYGDVTRLEVIDAEPSRVRPVGRLPGGSALIDVTSERPVRIRYEVGLRRPPTITDGPAPDLPLGGPTLHPSALPRAVREWIERNAVSERGAWEQARRVEAFVQRHYVYDLEFRERPAVERAARDLEPGVGNHHLQLLHAGGDHEALGYGVCYELNALVVELLRHLGIPSMIAMGWMLDEGFADRPDHLFALAVVPSVEGPCLLPLDASTGPRGPVRPLAGAEPPQVRIAAPSRPAIPDPSGGWGTPVLAGPERDVAVDEHVHTIHRALRAELDREREALRRVIRVAQSARGREPSAVRDDEDLPALRRRAERALGDPARLGPMLAVIRGDYDHAVAVPEPVQALVRDGLATVQTYASYRVRPADERDPSS